MNKLNYEMEFDCFIKSYIIPKIDEFQRLLEYIRGKFEYLEFKDKVVISDMLDSIYTKLDSTFDDFLYFNGKCINLLKEEEEYLLESITEVAYSVDDYDIDEEDNYNDKNNDLDEDIEYEENYFRKSNSNSSQTPYNETIDTGDEEMF